MEIELKISFLNTDVILIKNAATKNNYQKNFERAIATFFAIDKFNNSDFAIRFYNLFRILQK
jgi:hypothetical protein